MPCNHADVIDEVMTWMDAPWRHQGRSRNNIDCIGLVIKVAHELDLSSFDTADYDRRPDGVDFLAGFREHMTRVLPGAEQGGDVAVLRDDRLPCHCGFLVPFRNSVHFVHASAKRKKVVMEPFIGGLLARRIAIFQYKGLVD